MLASLRAENTCLKDALSGCDACLNTSMCNISGRKNITNESIILSWLIEHSELPLYVADMDDGFRMVFVNQATCRHYGLTKEELLEKRVLDWNPDFASAKLQKLQSDLLKEKQSFETVHRMLDGSIVPVEIQVSHIEIDGRNLAMGYIKDVTERKRKEEKLKQAALVYQHSHEAMIISDIAPESGAAIMADVNPAFAELTGYSREEILGSRTDILRAKVQDDVFSQSIFNTVAQTGKWQGEYYLRHKNGSTRLVWANVSGVRDSSDKLVGYVALLRDITQQKEDEVRLKLAALVYQNSFDLMVVYEMVQGNDLPIIVDVNQAFLSAYGCSREEIIGRSPEILNSERYPPEFYKNVVRELMETGFWQGEYRRTARDGRELISLVSAHLIYDRHGPASRIVSIERDITELKESEATVQALSASLIRAKEDEARRIAREVHDDAGQRLTWLKLNLSRLQKLIKNTPEELDNALSQMNVAVNQALDTIRNISVSLRPATLDMGFIMAVNWQVEEFRSNTGINCRLNNQLKELFTLPEEGSTGVFRILQEALTNVSRHADANQVEVTLRCVSGWFVMEIMDDGVGYNLDASRKSRSVGLTGMRERATMLGGKIELLSTLGHGATVRFTMPLTNICTDS